VPSHLLKLAAAVLASTTLLATWTATADGASLATTTASAVESSKLPDYISYTAQPVARTVKVYESRRVDSPSQEFPNPWLLNDRPDARVPQVFLVDRRKKKWVRVLLPVRPNGTTGWVRAKDVRLTPNRFRIVVERGAHQITVYNGDRVIVQEPIAVGTDDTPTPTGKFYLRVLLKAPNPNTVYGPYAFGLSGHSEVLTEFNGGDAEVGIHGNNDASVLGTSVTHGCIRMSNETITRLAGMLPLGTPVTILP